MTHPAPQPRAGVSSSSPPPKRDTELSPEMSAQVQAALQAHAHKPGPALPVLHAVQEALGCIPPQAIEPLARGLGLSRAELHGVVEFYPYFRREPAAAVHVELCRAEACQAMGAAALAAHARERLGCDFKQTSADGRYTLDPVFCLGLCAQSPAMMVNGEPHARLTTQRFDDIIAAQEHS